MKNFVFLLKLNILFFHKKSIFIIKCMKYIFIKGLFFLIVELNPSFGSEVWVNKKIEEEIEKAFKKLLKTDSLYYYYVSCPGESVVSECSVEKHKIIWLGSCGLINFIKKVQSKKFNAPILGVTSLSSKSKLEEKSEEMDTKEDYWIGDVNRECEMICGDRLFIYLWDRIKNQATRDSHIKV